MKSFGKQSESAKSKPDPDPSQKPKQAEIEPAEIEPKSRNPMKAASPLRPGSVNRIFPAVGLCRGDRRCRPS